MALPLDQAPPWVHDLLPTPAEEQAADREQATALAAGGAVPFEQLADRLGLPLDDPADQPQPGASQAT